MICKAVIIENRLSSSEILDVIDRHAKYLPESWDVLGIRNEPISSIGEYNKFLTSLRFWNSLKADKVLIFQADSGLLRSGVEDFLEWDFVGAPIKAIPTCMNGGLSLRDVEAMKRIIRQFPYQGESVHGNEDIYFCNKLNQTGGRMPPKEIAMRFSVETEYGLGSLGYHAMDKYLTESECKAIREQYD